MAIPLTIDNVHRICCMGAGRVGILSMAVLAEHHLDTIFVVLDNDVDIINFITNNNDNQIPRRLPFEEPDAVTLVNQRDNLIFSNDIAGELNQCRVIFIAVDVPLVEQPRSVKGDFDPRYLDYALRSVLHSMAADPGEKYVAIKSTIPLDYEKHIRNRISWYNAYPRLNIVTNPEFFSKGIAVRDLREPHKIVLGRFHRDGRQLFSNLYLPVVGGNQGRIEILDSLSSVELGKLLSNAILASQLTAINIGSTICERVGTNFEDVRRCLTAHPSIHDSYTNTGPGYGGLGLNRDVAYLAYLCSHVGLVNEMSFFTMLIKLRTQKMDALVNKIISILGTDRRTICIYGFANKVGTDDTRDSPAIYICTQLLKAWNVQLLIYDPIVTRQGITSCFLDRHTVGGRVEVLDNVNGAWDRTHGIVFLNRSPLFEQMLNNHLIPMVDALRPPKAIFDCCNLIGSIPPNATANLRNNATVYRLGMPV